LTVFPSQKSLSQGDVLLRGDNVIRSITDNDGSSVFRTPAFLPLFRIGHAGQGKNRGPGPLVFLLALVLAMCLSAVALAGNGQTAGMQSADATRSPDDLTAREAFAFAHDLFWRNPPEVAGILKSDQQRWYRLRLEDDETADRMLEIPHPILGVVDVWIRDSQGRSEHDRAGMRVPFSSRKQPASTLAFLIPGDLRPPLDVLVRVDNQGPYEFSAFVRPMDEWLQHEQRLTLFYGAFYGAMLVLLFYNLFLAWGLKDLSYFLYVLFLGSLLLSMVMQSGFGKQFMWPDNTGMEAQYLVLITAVSTATGLSFLNVFLNVRHLSRPLWLVSLLIVIAALLLALAYSLGYHPPWLITAVYFNMLLSLIYYMVVPVVAYLRGIRYARFAVLALWVYPFSAVLFFWQLAKGEYWLHPPHLVMALGMLAEGVLLSLALTDKINLLRQERNKIKQQAARTRKEFSRGLISAQEKEREKFASVLHDSIGHDLLILKHGMENLAGWGEKSQLTNRDVLKKLQEQCENALMDVRRLSHQMHPHVLKRLGLKAAIETMLENAAEVAGLDWAADLDEVDEKLNTEQASTIYRVIQEALNNILKHSRAKEVLVSMHDRGPQVVVSIKDDGTGEMPARQKPSRFGDKGLGIDNMQGRIELLSGWFRLIRKPGQGTEVRFGLPYG